MEGAAIIAKKLNLKSQSKRIRKQTVLAKAYTLLRYKSVHVILFAMFVFVALFLFSGYKKNNTESDHYNTQYIRSDLRIPAEPVFLRRSILARKIKDYFAQHTTNRPAIAVLGLVGAGGSGKTTLARAFGKTLSSTSVVWEINAETRDSILDSFKKLAYALVQTKGSKNELANIQCIQDADEMARQLVTFVATHLKRCPNWLLIYDNVKSFSDLESFFPHDVDRYGAGRVVITTQNQNKGSSEYINIGSVIYVDALNTSEMLTLFTKMTYNTEAYVFSREKEKKLIQFLSNIPPYPLDVSIVSYYIKNSDVTCEAYLEQMREGIKALNTSQNTYLKNSSTYTKARCSIITISIKRLIEIEPEFKNLLILASLAGAEDIQKTVFDSCEDPVLIDQFMYALKKYAFVVGRISTKHDAESTFSIHRDIHEIIKYFFMQVE